LCSCSAAIRHHVEGNVDVSDGFDDKSNADKDVMPSPHSEGIRGVESGRVPDISARVDFSKVRK
jgi:hypothetical protein